MTTSFWRLPDPPAQSRAGAVVVGAGVCGVSAALAFQRRGLDVAVLERHTIASGASSRAAGFLMRGAAENYAAAVTRYGRDLARTVWQWSEANLAGLREEGIEDLPSYRRVPSCLLALDGPELAELTASAQLLREDGFRVGWMDRGEDSVWRSASPLGGLINPDDAAANPLHLVQFLAQKLARPVREQHEVFAIEPAPGAGDGVLVRTSRGDVLTPRVLLCLNAYLPLLIPAFSEIVTPRRGQMLALRHPSLRLDCSYYANHGYEYFRQTPDGAIVLGGRRGLFADREIGYEDTTTGYLQHSLEQFAREMLGLPSGDLNIIARWSGVMGFSPDGLPLVGPVDGPWPKGSVWFCGAFTGHGMSMGYRTAHAAVGAMLDGSATPFPLDRVKPG